MTKKFNTIGDLKNSYSLNKEKINSIPKITKQINADMAFLIFNQARKRFSKKPVTYDQYLQYKKLTKLQRVKAYGFIDGWPE